MKGLAKITKVKVHYHRNGVAGEGFYLVTFIAEGRQLQAIRFPHEPGCCAIFDPLDPEGGWRYEVFVDAIDAAIRKHEAKLEAKRNFVTKTIARTI